MSTFKQIQANRANAKKSTGPQTLEAKAHVRFNALKHGFRAESVVIPGEDQDQFDRLLASLIRFWHVQDDYERDLVEQIAANQWKLARIDRYEGTIFAADMPEDKRTLSLQRITLTLGRLERAIAATVTQIQKYRAKLLEDREAAAQSGEKQGFIRGLTWILDEEETYYVLPQIRGLDGILRDIPRELLGDRFHPPDPKFKPHIVGKGDR